MKIYVLSIVNLLFVGSLAYAQDKSQDNSYQYYESGDFQFSTALIDDRNMFSLSSQLENVNNKSIDLRLKLNEQNLRDYRDYNFNLSNLNLSLPKLMLQKRIDFDSADAMFFFCGPLEDGLYRNLEAKGIMLGGFVDYFINEVLLKDLLHFKIGER